MKSEFDFIRGLRLKTVEEKPRFSSVKTGIGDDCAVIKHDSKTDLVLTADLLIEEIDFRLEWTKAGFI
jgi:thiamine monophosphate kinase